MRAFPLVLALSACTPAKYVSPSPIPSIPRKTIETWDCRLADGSPSLRITGADLPLVLSVWIDGDPVTCQRRAGDTLTCRISKTVVDAECHILPLTDEVTP